MKEQDPLRFPALALQLTARSVAKAADRAEARQQMLGHIADIAAQVRASCAFIQQYGGVPVRLVVLPEYLFTSFPGRTSIPHFADKAAIEVDGPEYEALGRLASSQNIYLAGNAYEADANFPGLYFQTSFIVAPSGDIVLRYRRLNSMFAPTPHDVWSQYLDLYGIEGVFPVASTAIGKLAAVASEEILYPEIARAHALRGAEIFVHSSSEIGSPLDTPKSIARRARALENMAYVVSANTAGVAGTAMPRSSGDGNSAVVDYKGQLLAQAYTGESCTAFADIDLAALRAARRKPGMTNMLSRQRTELFAPIYENIIVHPANSLVDGDGFTIPERDHFLRAQEAVIERLIEAGLI